METIRVHLRVCLNSLNFGNYLAFWAVNNFLYILGSLNPENPVQISIDQLTAAIYDLLRLHAFSVWSPADIAQSDRNVKEAWTTTEQLQFTIFAAHGISSNWVSK